MRKQLISAVALLASSSALAQEALDTTYAEEKRREIVSRNQSPDLDVRTGFAGSGVQLSAGSDSSSVTLTASRSWDSTGERTVQFNTATLLVTAPISDKDKKEGAFLTEGGLPKALSVQGSLTLAFSGNPPSPGTYAERRRLYFERRTRCLAEAGEDAAARTRCEDAIFDTGPGEPLVDAWNDSPVWFVGASATVGTRNFDYRSIQDFAEQDSDRTEYALSLFGGVNPDSRPLYLGLGFEYRRQYEAADSRTLCQPATGGAPQECFTAAFAAPERDIDSSLFAVARWKWDVDLGRDLRFPLGIAVKAAYDLEDRVFGVGVPVYFFSDSSGLRGGVRFDWQDVEDDDARFGFRIFVGTPFELFSGG